LILKLHLKVYVKPETLNVLEDQHVYLPFHLQYGEQGLEIAEAFVRSGAVDIVVVDSVAALTPKAEIEQCQQLHFLRKLLLSLNLAHHGQVEKDINYLYQH
jgi:RecA/RadA recombinase